MADDKKDVYTDVQDLSKSSELREKFDAKITKFNAEDYSKEDTKCIEFILTDKKEHKYQIYEKTFTVNELAKIKKNAKLELMALHKFVALIMYCLSVQNLKHDIKLKIEHAKYVQINMIYAPDDFTQVEFALCIAAKEMQEVDLLSLRLKEAEDTIAALRQQISCLNPVYEPILFAEIVTDSKHRSKGWNNIKLNYCSHTSDTRPFVSLNVDHGSINIAKGVYVVEAHAESWNVQGIIIQLKSDDEQITINGIPSYGASAIGTSRIMRQVMNVQDKCTLLFRQYAKIASDHGCHYNCHWPKQELANIYVACVSIQKLK